MRTAIAILVALSAACLVACGGEQHVVSLPDGGTSLSITGQPIDQEVTAPATATFTVVAEGTAPLTYQWKKNGIAVPGATSPSYTTPPTALGDDGATFTAVVTNSGGTLTSSPATLHVAPAPPSALFAYVANQSDNNVSVFRVDRSTGALLAASPATSPTGSAPSATATAQGRFLYVGCNGKVDAFRVNLNTGALTAIAGSPYAVAGVSGSAVAVSPDGTYLYAGGGATKLYSFHISADGTLSAVAGSPYSWSTYSLTRLSAAGNFLFGSGSTDLLVFRTSAGAVTTPDHATAGNVVYDFAPMPGGRYAYSADYTANVRAYSIDPVTGIMSQQPGTYTAEQGFSTRGAAVSPDGRFLYVLNRGGDVTRFNIAADGSLSPATGVVTTTGLNETFEHIVLDPDGRFLYLTNTAAAPHNFLIGFTVNQITGALAVMPSSFLGGVNEQGMAFIKVP
ncbi:MAG TPA: beta-propeller fold lactonase family protein [Burkholderiales bacterium]|nr:beta-propeller fold lactonase family protein [Burkholderiales bacterium]